MRLLIRSTMLLVALAAAALSFQSLMQLGRLCGYGSLSWLYPLVLDLGAAACCAEWLHNRKRQALWMTWALLVISVVLNGTVHYLTAQGTPPGWLLVVLVAAVPPAVFGLVVHLGWSTPAEVLPEKTRDWVEPEQDQLVEPPVVTEPVAALPPAAPERTDKELLAAVEAIADRDGKRPSRNVVTRELGIGAGRATRLLETFDQTGPRRRTA